MNSEVKKAIIIVALIFLGWIIIEKNKQFFYAKNPVQSDLDTSYVPLYLTYNYPIGFTNNNSALPALSIGLENVNSSAKKCGACNIFSSITKVM